jgi:hypothetical protein
MLRELFGGGQVWVATEPVLAVVWCTFWHDASRGNRQFETRTAYQPEGADIRPRSWPSLRRQEERLLVLRALVIARESAHALSELLDFEVL